MENFDNAALLLRLGLPPTLMITRHENRESFSKERKESYDNHVIFLPKSKMLRSQIFLVCTVAEIFDAYSEAVKTPF